MSIFNRFHLIFIISVVIPGLFLGYLSLRTIHHEKESITRSKEAHKEEFLDYMEKLLKKSEQNLLQEIQELLIRSSASASSRNYFFLTTDLLKSPLIRSVIILEKDSIVMPQLIASPFTNINSDPFENGKVKSPILKIQETYHKKNYVECLRRIERLDHNLDFITQTGALGTNYQYGFKLLKINCYKNMAKDDETILYGRQLIDDMLKFKKVTNYYQIQYFLEEALATLSSLENLPVEIRNNLWAISLRTSTFFANIERVREQWKPDVNILAQMKGKSYQEGIQILHYEGLPYLKIRFPWIDSRSQVIAKLDHTLFSNLIRSETAEAKRGPWRDIEYAVYNFNNVLIDAPYGIEEKQLSLERILNLEIPQWKIEIFQRPEDTTSFFGNRKIFMLYLLLGLSICILVIGTYTSVRGIINERRIVRMKSNFLSSVTHELKSPLTSIRMFAELLELGKQVSTQKIKKYASLIGQETQRLQGMIENILNSARFEDKQYKIAHEQVNLSELIKEVAEFQKNAFAKQNLGLMLDLEPDVFISGKHDALRSVIQNLLDNALKYSHKGMVRVTLTSNDVHHLLIVKDDGIGIPSEAIKYIFDKFYRVQDEMTRNTKGTGIGLALVKQILEHHNAKITVRSKLDVGTEFIITFPI
ncbi:MAG: hypothetical protein HQK83_03610 [Fibrobacteria bacterium]|nr:hypothetical protein [Fibrobacteria bacterium]